MESKKNKRIKNILIWVVVIIFLAAFYLGYRHGRADKHAQQELEIESGK